MAGSIVAAPTHYVVLARAGSGPGQLPPLPTTAASEPWGGPLLDTRGPLACEGRALGAGQPRNGPTKEDLTRLILAVLSSWTCVSVAVHNRECRCAALHFEKLRYLITTDGLDVDGQAEPPFGQRNNISQLLSSRRQEGGTSSSSQQQLEL